MSNKFDQSRKPENNTDVTIDSVKEAILSMGEELREAEAIGIFGSLARGRGFTERSDIDIFVVVKEKKDHTVTDYWYHKIRKVLGRFERDITVKTYSVGALKRICSWYVLRLASDGIIIYDQGGIKELFGKIVKAACDSGLEENSSGDYNFWYIKDCKIGDIVTVEVKDD